MVNLEAVLASMERFTLLTHAELRCYPPQRTEVELTTFYDGKLVAMVAERFIHIIPSSFLTIHDLSPIA